MQGQGSNHLGSGPLPSDVVGNATEPQRPPADYQPAGPALISVADAETLKLASATSASQLSALPNDPTGKQSQWYTPLLGWTLAANQAAAQKTHEAVFTLIPAMADFFGKNPEAEDLAPQFIEVRDQMEACGVVIITAIGNHISESAGIVSGTNVRRFARVYAAGRFYQEGEWEGEKPMINAAGIMILDAAAVVTQLKAGPWQQAKQFLGGATTASGYFTRYVGSGEGLAVLKTKYAANQTAIDAKFSELKTWTDAQEQQAGGGN
jgi:hypothetical protein